MDSDNTDTKRQTQLIGPSDAPIIPEGGYKSSGLLAPPNNVTRTAHRSQLPTLHERQNDTSLWMLDGNKYQVAYGIRSSRSAQYIAVVYSVPITKELYDVRTVTGDNTQKLRAQLRQIDHPSFIQIRQVFESKAKLYIVCEHAECSLKEVVFSPVYPSEIQLASIMSQVLDGILYMASLEFVHSELSYEKLILSKDGDVRIGTKSADQNRDIRALGSILFSLMEKTQPERDGNFTSSLSNNWSRDIIEFLNVTRLASPLELHDI
ncbi:hypothetical protein K432DRAFT_396643 [Lepidopterella palustris CBS 459.81]|uniref:Protein kinase domain-containing protein n=1 Tax=Lepidopterella palustris CBS 459.81 TaxID=1314670 RepID=A0A8E2E2P9_9PEZI|nr:hypothetical protein K432DRAFT_396643 [Lepidopterella palustris CBS 459.81]